MELTIKSCFFILLFVDSVVYGTIRSAYEYSGQKCSACSRMYVPDSLWPEVNLLWHFIKNVLFFVLIDQKEF